MRAVHRRSPCSIGRIRIARFHRFRIGSEGAIAHICRGGHGYTPIGLEACMALIMGDLLYAGLDVLERAAGIEPASLAWKARVLPLHNARRPMRPMPTARLSQGMDGARQQLNAVLKPQDEIDSRIRSATGGCKRRLPQSERLCFFTTTGLFCGSHPRGRTVTSGVCIRRHSSLCFQSSMPFERKAN